MSIDQSPDRKPTYAELRSSCWSLFLLMLVVVLFFRRRGSRWTRARFRRRRSWRRRLCSWWGRNRALTRRGTRGCSCSGRGVVCKSSRMMRCVDSVVLSCRMTLPPPARIGLRNMSLRLSSSSRAAPTVGSTLPHMLVTTRALQSVSGPQRSRRKRRLR